MKIKTIGIVLIISGLILIAGIDLFWFIDYSGNNNCPDLPAIEIVDMSSDDSSFDIDIAAEDYHSCTEFDKKDNEILGLVLSDAGIQGYLDDGIAVGYIGYFTIESTERTQSKEMAVAVLMGQDLAWQIVVDEEEQQLLDIYGPFEVKPEINVPFIVTFMSSGFVLLFSGTLVYHRSNAKRY